MSKSFFTFQESILKKNLIFKISHQIKYTYALYIAHELKLFSLINAHKNISLEEICDIINLRPRAAQALLSLCVSCGLLKVKSNEIYKLTQSAKYYLLPESPFYWGDLLDINIKNPEIFSYQSYKNAILENRPQIYQGKNLFQNNEVNNDLTISFTKAMHSKSMASAMFWPKVLELSEYYKFLDIGGGSGVHSIAAVFTWSNLKAIVYDRPTVCKVAQSFIEESNFKERIETYVGNMWEDNFPDADVHFYCDIFHDWTIADCEILSNKSYNALPKNGRIIIHEVLFNNNKGGSFSAAALNLSMLLWTQGQQLSQNEIIGILAKSGFKELEIIPTSFGDWSIVTGVK